MKTTICNFKTKLLGVLLIFLLYSGNIFSQNEYGTCTVIQQPCHGDGSFSVAFSTTLTLPLTVFYGQVTYEINSYNYIFENLTSASGYLYGYDSNNNWFDMQTGMVEPFYVDWPQTQNPLCPDLTGTVTVTVNGGQTPYLVEWFAGELIDTNIVYTTGNIVELPEGYYHIRVWDAQGCYSMPDSNFVNIVQQSNITAQINSTLANCTNGTITVNSVSGGTAPYSYLWSNGANTSSLTNLSQGYYQLTITDAQGCHNSFWPHVNQAVYINSSPQVTNATCLESDGALMLWSSGGTAPYTYQYSNGMSGQSINGLTGNQYIYFTVTDANGCIGSNGAYISANTPINASYSSTPSSCTSATGSSTLNITGGAAPYNVSWYTSPAQTGLTISNMAPGNYSFLITDVNGCVRSGTAVVPPESTINAYTTSSSAVCPNNNGTASVIVSGSNPPYSYNWSNGATTASLAAAMPGYYSVTVTDNVSCSLIKSVYVNSLSPVSLGMATVPATCIFSSDGSSTVTPVGGTSPYSILWSNGQNTTTASGLQQGYYNVQVTDANNCIAYNWTLVPYDANNDDCYCEIKGNIYADLNSNCSFDATELGIENIMVHAANWGYTFTNSQGFYSFKVPSGTYTVSEIEHSFYPLSPCQQNDFETTVVASSGCDVVINFANQVVPIHDISIARCSYALPVPGLNYSQYVLVKNTGTVSESDVQLGFGFDEQIQYVNSSSSVYQFPDITNYPQWLRQSSNMQSLNPGEVLYENFNFILPGSIPLNTQLEFFDTAAYAAPMSNWVNDYSPGDNISSYYPYVVGSYDPNFKEVTPVGQTADHFITRAQSELTYTIHFQNTGTYYANNIKIVDTLDSNLDWTTLQPFYSDHAFNTNMDENGVVTFTFPNINLLWQEQSEEASKGLIIYKIKQKPNLSDGTIINNSASIYFDYNAPIYTNSVFNTVKGDGNPITEITKTVVTESIKLYPNPAQGYFVVSTNSNESIVRIVVNDITGRCIKQVNTGNSFSQKVQINDLPSGVYLIETTLGNNQKSVVRLVKE